MQIHSVKTSPQRYRWGESLCNSLIMRDPRNKRQLLASQQTSIIVIAGSRSEAGTGVALSCAAHRALLYRARPLLPFRSRMSRDCLMQVQGADSMNLSPDVYNSHRYTTLAKAVEQSRRCVRRSISLM